MFWPGSRFLSLIPPLGHRTPSVATRGIKVYPKAPTVSLAEIPEVEIDAEGKFKYVLVRLTDPYYQKDKVVVRGSASAKYHSDIFEPLKKKLHDAGIDAQCVGGGRILHQPERNSILVYGESQGYGKADHAATVELLKRKYPTYESVAWLDEDLPDQQ